MNRKINIGVFSMCLILLGSAFWATAETITIKAVDFSNVTAGAAPYKINERYKCLAIPAGAEANRDKWAAATWTFSGKTGSYDIVLRSLLEWDGESPYRLSVNGVVVGEAKNRVALRSENYDVQEHVFRGVQIKGGDEVKVESMAVTNGKVPENGGTAYARGRWLELELIDTSVSQGIEPSRTNEQGGKVEIK